eukprot:1143107-Pelagomonas_calceolata.AAC.4
MLDENVSPAADQPDFWAVGQPLVTLRVTPLRLKYHLTDRPHTTGMLWLTKAYALPASMYARFGALDL